MELFVKHVLTLEIRRSEAVVVHSNNFSQQIVKFESLKKNPILYWRGKNHVLTYLFIFFSLQLLYSWIRKLLLYFDNIYSTSKIKNMSMYNSILFLPLYRIFCLIQERIEWKNLSCIPTFLVTITLICKLTYLHIVFTIYISYFCV